MEFFRNNTHSTHICRRAYIPNQLKDEVKEILGNLSNEEKIEINTHLTKKPGFFRSDLYSDKIYSILQANETDKNQRDLFGKKHYSHEEKPKLGQATLKRNIIFDSSLGCCVPLYTRKPGCARMKLDIIDYGKSENQNNFTYFDNEFKQGSYKNQESTIHKNFNQHFFGCSTNVIGEIRDEFGHKYDRIRNKLSKVNKSSVHFENDYYMPEEGSSYENINKVRHGINKNYNGSRLAFLNGFLTSIS